MLATNASMKKVFNVSFRLSITPFVHIKQSVEIASKNASIELSKQNSVAVVQIFFY